jgi:hypothetical protein
MLQQIQRASAMGLALLLAVHACSACAADECWSEFQSEFESGSTGYVLRAESDLVLTNVVVRDAKTGQVVRG